ncbi:S8 family serine peptidase [candidate division KSB1 bacterium]|nr:S8 family serine peptidase [candidate division KSB1 bacterium]
MKSKIIIITVCITIMLLGWVNQSVKAAATFEVALDFQLKGDPERIPGPGQNTLKVGVIMNPDGILEQFVQGQVILKPKSEDDLNNFVKQWGATILSDGSIPDPPQKYEHLKRIIPTSSGYHCIRINPSSVDIQQGLIDDATALGLKGKYTFSSIEILQLFGLFLDQTKKGVEGLDLNGVFKLSECYETSTQELSLDPAAPDPTLDNDGYYDAYWIRNFSHSDIQVTDAWQFVELYGSNIEIVPTCLIDAGFMLNDDFGSVMQYDFVSDDRDVDADEEGYHGARTLSVACAQLNDRFGSAGTGGQVTLPMPFRFNLTYEQGARAIRTATSWGAQVISESWGGPCDWWCDTFGGISGENAINEALDEAYDHGVALLAAAGNSETNLNDAYYLPAEGGSSGKGNIIVGAMDLDSKVAANPTDHGWGSSFGNALDTWIPVIPRITSTPTPDDTSFSTIGRTSGACAYAAGVVAMMRSLCPTLTVAEVYDIVDDSNRDSPDPRVACGYLNVFDAVHRAASHAGAVDPSLDIYEPNEPSDCARIDSGSYCANLSGIDTEDGYSFWVDDIRSVEVSENTLFLGEYIATLNGFGIEDGTFPFNDTLVPGSYQIHFTRTSSTPCFYELNLNIEAPTTMAPDRFEVNNTFATAAEIVLPGNRVGREMTVEDINFHVSGDPDYFELRILPDLEPTKTDRLTIWIEPDELTGFSSSTRLAVFDNAGTLDPACRGLAYTISHFRDKYPDGRMKFEVYDNMGHRNNYRMIFGYDQFVRGVTEPSTFTFYDIPDWIPDPSDLYFLHILNSPLDGLPIDFPFPGNPALAEMIAAGKPPTSIPDEMMILKWPEFNSLGMNISFFGNASNLSFHLVDQKGDVLAEAMEIPNGLKKEFNESNRVIKRIDYKELKRGIYGIRVSNTQSQSPSTIYSVQIDSIGYKSGVTRRAEQMISSSILLQNYPNPFNPNTEIKFNLPISGEVKLVVYDVLGHVIKTLAEEEYEAGYHTVIWNGRNMHDAQVATGVYFYRIEVSAKQGGNASYTNVKKMLMLK